MRPILFVFPEGLPGIGGVPVFSYGVMLGLSLVLGWYLTLHLSDRDGIARRTSAGAIVVGIVMAMLGARGLHLAADPGSVQGWSSFFEMDSGGLVAYGGYLGGLVGGGLYMAITRAKVGYFRFVDHAAPAFALGLGITRIGCFLYGCDFGHRTESGLGVRFGRWTSEQLPWIGGPCEPHGCGPLSFCSPMTQQCEAAGAPAWALHKSLGYVDAASELSAAVHPVQLYASAAGFVLFGVLMLIHARRRFEGQVMLSFVGLYALARYVLELFREDPERGFVLAFTREQVGALHHLLVAQGVAGAPGEGAQVLYLLTTSQFISVVMLSMVAVLGWWGWRRSRGQTERTWWGLGVPVDDDKSAS